MGFLVLDECSLFFDLYKQQQQQIIININNNTPLLSSTTAGTPDESPINLQIECSDQHHQQQQSLSPSTTKHCSTVQISLGNNSKSSGSGNDNFQNKNVKISIMGKEVEEKKDNDQPV